MGSLGAKKSIAKKKIYLNVNPSAIGITVITNPAAIEPFLPPIASILSEHYHLSDLHISWPLLIAFYIKNNYIKATQLPKNLPLISMKNREMPDHHKEVLKRIAADPIRRQEYFQFALEAMDKEENTLDERSLDNLLD